MKLSVKDRKLLKISIPVAFILIGCIFVMGKIVGALDDPLRFLGFLTCVKVFFDAIKMILRANFFKSSKHPTFYGNWAVITGCTSGIGEAFAYHLAKEGLNIVLVSRSEEKLETVSQNIKMKYSVKTKILVHDFSSDSIESLSKSLSDFISSLNGESVGILVNNVGVANETPEYFHLLSENKINEMISVNLKSVLFLTHTVLPVMLKAKRGAIINVSSACGTHPTPLLSVYSATKTFMTQLSNSLSYEYEKEGIDVLAITPYYFLSSYFKSKEPTLGIPHPSTIVDSTMRKLGRCKQTFPYWFHALQRSIFNFHPDWPKRLMYSMKANKQRAQTKKKA